MVEIAYINFGIANFYLEILVLLLLFCGNSLKRKLWSLRLIVSSAIGVVFFFLFPKIMLFDWWNGAFLCIFILNTLVMKFTFKIRFRQIIIYGIAAMSIQNLTAKLVTFIFIFGASAFWERTLLQLLINDVLFVFVCAIFWRLFVARKQRNDIININNVRFSILLSVSAVNIFLFSPLSDNFVSETLIRVLCMCMLITIDIMVLCAEFGVFEKSDLEKENEMIERMLYLRDTQKEMFKNSIDLINQKCHDIRHQIAMLRNGNKTENASYIKEVEGALSGYELNVMVGNEVLDTVLTEYCLRCKQENIRFTYMVDGEALSFMESFDLYSFFGNALENAVEALLKEKVIEKRLLYVTVKRQQGVVIINIENYFCGTLKMEHDLPKTTKTNNGFHGYGLKSIHFITEKYDGHLRIKQKDDRFVLQAIFPGR